MKISQIAWRLKHEQGEGYVSAAAFPCIDNNKMEVFSFLAANAATTATDKQVVSTYHTDVPRDI